MHGEDGQIMESIKRVVGVWRFSYRLAISCLALDFRKKELIEQNKRLFLVHFFFSITWVIL